MNVTPVLEEAGGPARAARILVVEDEKIVALDICEQLEDLGYRVVGVCSSGEEAIAAAQTYAPDLALVDVSLEGRLDGLSAGHAIRLMFDVPVVVVTAHVDERTVLRAESTWMDGFVVKPFPPQALSIAIRLALSRHRRERILRYQCPQQGQCPVLYQPPTRRKPLVDVAPYREEVRRRDDDEPADLLEPEERASLSPRELEVFGLFAAGLSATDIAQRLGISPHTARNHLKALYRKLDIDSQHELRQLLSERRKKREAQR